MDRCSKCHDWLMPDEPGPLCWQCDQETPSLVEPEVPVLDMSLALPVAQRWLILFAAFMTYLLARAIPWP